MKMCRECDEDNPHEVFKGQRRVTCDACGRDSHWFRAVYHTEECDRCHCDTAGYAVRDGWSYGEEFRDSVSAYGGLLRDGQSFRMSACCNAPARLDLKGRVPHTFPRGGRS